MARSFSVKKRDSFVKTPKPLLLLIAEGKNITEAQYFRQFQRQHSTFNIKILTPGSATDPEKMLETLERYWKQYDMTFEKGDKGFVVLDLDCSEKKAQLIEKLEYGTKIARFIVSNPCFEVWFVLHFRYSTHVYSDGNEVIKELKQHIPEYQKNTEVKKSLSGMLDTALENARKLVDYYEEMGYHWPSVECNPRTDVPEIIYEIMRLGGDVN